jgi:hypothetical protein
MEVHHHAHTSRKRWTHYFWEFLMLFLAVFAGFMAENQREHYIEHQRAKQLARNLYKELYQDSVSIQNCIANRHKKEKQCSYFIAYVKDSSLEKPSNNFFPSFTSALIQIQFIIFEPNDGILNQLRNSGELRYFKNSELQSEIGKLGVTITHTRLRNEREYSYVEFYNRPFLLKHFDFDWYEAYTDKGRMPLTEALQQNLDVRESGKIQDLENFDRKNAQNITAYYLLLLRSTRLIQYKNYIEANARVMALLRKEFHIKN